ncbi:Tad domain-containing protein [Catellatospora sichuanensis]|uniref:Tad domain-containing protein n=1 Tax=Catellatospora sichuanensis TaxID=1969805 RepID=UPI00164253B8|nr:Tad domain-containing protein [Catellatospora sichuanensis]
MPLLTIARARRDRGAAATIVAILLAGGVLLGMSALVVDVGRLYIEREELQSGADAAAMAVGLDCAMGGIPARDAQCRAAAGTAPLYADGNAKDNASAVRFVCGNDARLPSCTGAGSGNLSDCIGSPPANARYVEVRTRTELADGSSILPAAFAQTLAGGYSGSTVGACARVGWGSPATGLALTFCLTEWTAATSGGYAPPPPAVPNNSFERVLKTKEPGRGGGPGGGGPGHGGGPGGGGPVAPCTRTPSGGDLPGGFGWTDTPSRSSCVTRLTAAGTYEVDPGADVPHACETVMRDARTNRTPLAVPIYDPSPIGTGSGGTYQLNGFAAFILTGWANMPGGMHDATSTLTGRDPDTMCNPGDQCIFGYFTNALVPWTGEFGSTPSYGATVIKTIG